jgi:hypothetical protein
MLADIPEEILEIATRHVISRHKYHTWPTIAEIREACIDIQTGAREFPTAYEAWDQVCTAIRRYGFYRGGEALNSLETNPLIWKSIDSIGGWRMLCQSDNPVADRARFVDAYTIFLKRATEETYTLPVVTELARQLSVSSKRLLQKPQEPV